MSSSPITPTVILIENQCLSTLILTLKLLGFVDGTYLLLSYFKFYRNGRRESKLRLIIHVYLTICPINPFLSVNIIP